MTPKTVWAVYFSGTGTTERTVRSLAGELARMLSVPCRSIDFTRPQARQKELSFCERDLVVFGTPVYAGRVPNVLLPYLRDAAAIICEEGSAECHAATVGLLLSKPVLVGAGDATRRLEDGVRVSVDCARGVVQTMPQ